MTTNLPTVVAIYLALLLISLGYNYLVAYLDRHGYLHGNTWVSVACGVAYTVAMTAFISPLFALIVLGAFVMSGIPMALGAMYRHANQRKAIELALRQDIYDQAKDLA